MADFQALKDAVVRAVDARRSSLEDLALRIHANPEIAFEEYKAARWQTEMLEQGGYEVERGTAGLETAFRADYRGPKPGPTIAMISQYDALANLGHACGHNLVPAASVGAALALKDACGDLPGRIEVIGCPAEESGGGKIIMVDKGVFDGVDAALMAHGHKRTRSHHWMLAMTDLTLKFYGKASHAASAPTQGISALDALIHTFVAINSLRQFFKDGSRVHGIVTRGGDAPNIIPAYAEGRFFVRGDTVEQVMEMKERVLVCAEAQAKAVGARFEPQQGVTYAERVPNMVMSGLIDANLRQLGVEVEPPGAPAGARGSSDLGNVGLVCPIVGANIKMVPLEVSTHSREFLEAAKSQAGLEVVSLGAKAMAMTAIDLCYLPENMAAVTAEWRAWKAQRAAQP